MREASITVNGGEAVVRWCEHGENVQDQQTDRGCSGCVRGICGAALACELPEDDTAAAKRRPSLSRRARNRLLLAAIGCGGVLVCGVAELFYRLT